MDQPFHEAVLGGLEALEHAWGEGVAESEGFGAKRTEPDFRTPAVKSPRQGGHNARIKGVTGGRRGAGGGILESSEVDLGAGDGCIDDEHTSSVGPIRRRVVSRALGDEHAHRC